MNKLISYLLTYSSTICFEQAKDDKSDFKVCCLVLRSDVCKLVDLVFEYDCVYNLSFHPIHNNLINVSFCIDNNHIPF